MANADPIHESALPQSPVLTVEYLRSRLHYVPETGVFVWKQRPGASRFDRSWNTQFAGKQAGALRPNGYFHIGINGRLYLAHRLAFLYMTGQMPPGDVDHRDTNKVNNRWDNLRLATKSQNGANVRPPASNTSGFKGVAWRGENRRWRATIGKKHLGTFETLEGACRAYADAAKQKYGEFARAALPARRGDQSSSGQDNSSNQDNPKA